MDTIEIPSRIQDSALVARRREELIDASLAVFLEQGFHRTTVREIAEAAGWQMGTLYTYIGRKEDLLYLIVERLLDRCYAPLGRIPANLAPDSQLEWVVKEVYGIAHELRAELRFMYRESASLLPDHLAAIKERESRYVGTIVDVVNAGVASGQFRNVHAELVAHEIAGMAALWALKRWRLRDAVGLDEYIRFETELILRFVTPTSTEAGPNNMHPAPGGSDDSVH